MHSTVDKYDGWSYKQQTKHTDVINDFQGKQSAEVGDMRSTGRLWNNASDTVSWGSTYGQRMI
jgi:hypothetical protein